MKKSSTLAAVVPATIVEDAWQQVSVERVALDQSTITIEGGKTVPLKPGMALSAPRRRGNCR